MGVLECTMSLDELAASIAKQGDKVRALKAEADIDDEAVQAEVRQLLELKAAFVAAGGVCESPSKGKKKKKKKDDELAELLPAEQSASTARHCDKQSGPDVDCQRTNDEATVSKAAAAEAGYFDDPFAQHFCVMKRRSPLINLGYATRTCALDAAYRALLPRVDQVIVVGAGFDTASWRYHSQYAGRWVEVDFPEVIRRKRRLCADASLEPPEMVGADLRDLPELRAALMAKGLSADAPTLVVSEVVLAYVDEAYATGVITEM